MKFAEWFADRSREPSTWAGTAALLQAVATVMADPTNAGAWGTVVAGVFAIALKERGG